MSISIWKYPLKVEGEQLITVPVGAEFIHCALQHGTITLWAKVDTTLTETQVARILTLGTGHQYDGEWRSLKHLGSVLTMHDRLVFHVFEIEPRKAS